MPRYDYHCEANGRTVEVVHGINERMLDWGQVCDRARIDAGETERGAPVNKVITTAPMANTPVGDSHLKNLGFTKLVKRSDGNYENVTRSGSEARIVKPGQKDTLPHFHKKISD